MAQPDFSIATHRVVRIDGGPLDYPARHVVIGPGAIASHRAWQSLGTGAKRVVSALTGAIAIALRFLGSDRGFTFYLGFYAGCMATVGLALLWSFFL